MCRAMFASPEEVVLSTSQDLLIQSGNYAMQHAARLLHWHHFTIRRDTTHSKHDT